MIKITPEKIEELESLLSPCRLCPRECGADRMAGEKGMCGAGRDLKVASYHQHFGEEACLVGRRGSGTIFLSHCNLACVFCQNHDISQAGVGRVETAEAAARMMLDLQDLGCHNVNFVTPTPWIPQLVKALALARSRGLTLPVVYNTGGYDSAGVLRRLEGIVDIYMPDLKYGSNARAERYSGVPDYWDRAREALKEMQRQAGDLQVADGIARRGLLVRHLVLPGDRAETRNCLEFISREISPRCAVNVMDQYRPLNRAAGYPEIDRPVTPQEYRRAVRIREELGLSAA